MATTGIALAIWSYNIVFTCSSGTQVSELSSGGARGYEAIVTNPKQADFRESTNTHLLDHLIQARDLNKGTSGIRLLFMDIIPVLWNKNHLKTNDLISLYNVRWEELFWRESSPVFLCVLRGVEPGPRAALTSAEGREGRSTGEGRGAASFPGNSLK